MKTICPFLICFLVTLSSIYGQNGLVDIPCSHDEILKRHLELNPDALSEREKNEQFIQAFIKKLKEKRAQNATDREFTDFVIPTVLHVFHHGDDGKIDMEQALSGLEIINRDFNGLNDDWNEIDPAFDPIKATLNIELCLATIDPEGNPTNGVIYYENEEAMYNNIDLFDYAWDNYKYLNIYLPKYTNGGPSDFTAYAYYPSTWGSDNNQGGIFYSSIRWGFGSHSELDPGAEWASVGTHEMGHWLDLRHTFELGCSFPGDLVGDTPPTMGGTLEFSGCYNNDFSCGVATNGENYMDYNHDCKKMFTQGQVDRMLAALNLPSRITLWSASNLEATGCLDAPTSIAESFNKNAVKVYPNPANDFINFDFAKASNQLSIFNAQGKLVFKQIIAGGSFQLNTANLARGLYFYQANFENGRKNGKFILH